MKLTKEKSATKTTKTRKVATKKAPKTAKKRPGKQSFWDEWYGIGLKHPENKKAKYKKTADLWR